MEFKLELDFLWDISVTERTLLSWSIPAWCVLAVPSSEETVDLGTGDAQFYDPATGIWKALASGEHKLFLATNVPDGLTLSAAARSQGGQPADLSRFTLACCSGSEKPLSSPQELFSSSQPGVYKISDLVYRYHLSWEDAPGSYAVDVTYTLTAP